MKLNCFILVVLLVLITGCERDSSTVEYDFSRLGLEKIMVDTMTIPLESTGFPVKGENPFVIVGTSNEISLRRYELVVWNGIVNEKSIAVKSKYNDLSVEITRNDNVSGYVVTVSRSGFPEKVIYTLSFLNVSKP
jgi:hypothetical protein